MENLDEAQRVLERKALLNVRALVDKLETEERSRTSNALRFAIRFTPALFVLLVIVSGIAVYVASRSRQLPQPPLDAAAHVEQIFLKIERDANGRLRSEVNGLNGRVSLRFDVKPDGYIDNLVVVNSSHDTRVDGQATRLAKALEPYRPLSPSREIYPLRVTGTFRFASDSNGRGALTIERIETRP